MDDLMLIMIWISLLGAVLMVGAVIADFIERYLWGQSDSGSPVK